jgi:hypothetical protein
VDHCIDRAPGGAEGSGTGGHPVRRFRHSSHARRVQVAGLSAFWLIPGPEGMRPGTTSAGCGEGALREAWNCTRCRPPGGPP